MINPKTGEWFHDYVGWIMMILAMLMIWGEMTLISMLFQDVSTQGPLALQEVGVGQFDPQRMHVRRQGPSR